MSNDLISRQALCEYALNQKDKSVTPNDIMRFPPADTDLSAYSDKLWQAAYERGKKEAEAGRKRGKWIKEKSRGQLYQCSACNNYLDFRGVNAGRGSANYCPNCGADMRGGQNGLS